MEKENCCNFGPASWKYVRFRTASKNQDECDKHVKLSVIYHKALIVFKAIRPISQSVSAVSEAALLIRLSKDPILSFVASKLKSTFCRVNLSKIEDGKRDIRIRTNFFMNQKQKKKPPIKKLAVSYFQDINQKRVIFFKKKKQKTEV